MMIVKHKEGFGFPPKELMDAIDKLSEEAVQAGTKPGSCGLKPTDTGARMQHVIKKRKMRGLWPKLAIRLDSVKIGGSGVGFFFDGAGPGRVSGNIAVTS